MRASLQRNVREIAITAAQLWWWLKEGNVLVQCVFLFLSCVFVFKEPFLCLLAVALICRSLSYALETKASMRSLFSAAGLTWLHSHAKATIKSPNATQNIVRPTPTVPSYTDYTCKFYVYVTNNDEIVLRIHSGKDAAVDENLNESCKELS